MMKPIIQRPVPQYQALPGMMSPIPIREFRGLNTFDPFSIRDNHFTHMSNMVLDDYPAVSVRPGYSVLESAIGTRVLGLGVWKGTELHAIFNDGTWRKWTGSAWTTLKSGLDTAAEWTFTNFEGNWSGINLIGCNGVNGLHRYDGNTVQTFGNAPSNINYVTTYQNRLWGAFGLEIRACKLDDGNEWELFDLTEEASYGKTLESDKGESINMLSGGLSKLIIGMPNALHELYGGVPSDFWTRLVTTDTGFANNKSAFIQDSLLRFIHKNGIYEYVSGGVAPDRDFSEIIRELYSETNALAATDGRRFYFRMDSNILIYDQHSQSWSSWNGISATCFALMDGQAYMGDASGRVLLLDGSTDDGSAIPWEIITKPFTNASAGQRSRWLKLWAMIQLVPDSTATISLSQTKDGSDWETVKTITGTGLNIEKVIIPIKKFTLASMLRIKISGTGWVKIHEITRQGRAMSQ